MAVTSPLRIVLEADGRTHSVARGSHFHGGLSDSSSNWITAGGGSGRERPPFALGSLGFHRNDVTDKPRETAASPPPSGALDRPNPIDADEITRITSHALHGNGLPHFRASTAISFRDIIRGICAMRPYIAVCLFHPSARRYRPNDKCDKWSGVFVSLLSFLIPRQPATFVSYCGNTFREKLRIPVRGSN